MSKIIYIGNFGNKNTLLSSQVKKTIIIKQFLEENGHKVVAINTMNFFTLLAPFTIIKFLWYMIFSNKIIVSLNKNGLSFLRGIFLKAPLIFKNKNKVFVTIGGWLPNFLKTKKHLINSFKKYDKIYTQSKYINDQLIQLGYKNTSIVYNFKNINSDKVDNLRVEILNNYEVHDSIKLVFFSHLRKEKGLDVALKEIQLANSQIGYNFFKFDVFGPIYPSYKNEFETLLRKYNFKYKGTINNDDDIFKTLSKYDFLVFPTYYDGEGFPTVIVDAFYSGLPTIASNWKSNSEIIDDGVNGFLFDLKEGALAETLLFIYNNKAKIISLKLNCLDNIHCYSYENRLKIILDDLKLRL